MKAPFEFARALVRAPSRSVTRGLRAHGGEGPTFDGVLQEHRAYVAALAEAGVTVEILPALEEFPDSVFVEDPALVFPEGAILLRPGAPSRRGEVEELATELTARFEETQALDIGFADGGDVINLGDRILIGVSARTNEQGAKFYCRSSAAALKPWSPRPAFFISRRTAHWSITKPYCQRSGLRRPASFAVSA